jgi:hypothetical protein
MSSLSTLVLQDLLGRRISAFVPLSPSIDSTRMGSSGEAV